MADPNRSRRRNIDFPRKPGASQLPEDSDGGKHEDPDAADSRLAGEEGGRQLAELSASLGGQDMEADGQDIVVDAIANLLHFAASMGMNVEDITRVAEGHFEYEQDAIYGDDRDDEDE